MSNRIGVMYLGKIVKSADSDERYAHQLHPYTEALYSATLPFHPETQRQEIILPGEMLSPINPPPGWRFHPCCTEAMKVCFEVEPGLTELNSGHYLACHQEDRAPYSFNC